MSKIYDFPLYYNLIRRYILFAFRHFYGEFIVLGKENIPTSGATIFAPNHLNALMDALAVQYIAPRTLPVVFLAKADLFEKSWMAKILRITKIMPAYRMRDGIELLDKNKEIFQQCIDTLTHKKALGIMPEGNQGEQRKIRPLKKGLMRIALEAQQHIGTTDKVYIVPIGIDLGCLDRFGTRIIINIGKPIEVDEYLSNYTEQAVAATNSLRDRLRDEMISLTVHIDSTQHHERYEHIIHIISTSIHPSELFASNSTERFLTEQKLATRINVLETENPNAINKLLELARDYQTLITTNKIKLGEANEYKTNPLQLTTLGIILVLSSAVFLLGFCLNGIPLLITRFLRKSIRLEYSGFISSVDFAIAGVLFPIAYLLQTYFFYTFISHSLICTAVFFIAQYLCGLMAMRWYQFFKRFSSSVNQWIFKNFNRTYYVRLEQIRREMINLLT